MGADDELPSLGARLLSTRASSRAGRPRARWILLAAALLAAAPPVSHAHASASPAWSPPLALSRCPAAGPVQAAFPTDGPSHPTGSGAVVWPASAACPGGPGARMAPIGSGDVPGATFAPRSPSGRSLAPSGPLAVSGAPHGQIAIAGATPGEAGHGLLIQGAAQGPFASLTLPGGLAAAPLALDHAYLGDVGLVSASGPGANPARLRFDVERYFATSPSRDVTVTAPAASVRALTLALDYRTDALVLWVQGTSLYTRDLPASRAPASTQRLGSAGPHVRVAALLSDDNRAIVAWTDDRAGTTSVYLDRSAVGVRFGAPTLLERFRDPDGLRSPVASPRLIRLSSESVMIAWAGSSAGHWAVRAAPIDRRGLRTVTTIAAPTGDALLADLVPGPDDDALALWTEPVPGADGTPDMGHQAILAARGFDTYPGQAIFGAPEPVAPPALVLDAGAAIDPSNDRAIAMWRGEGAVAEYSIRTPPDGR